MLKVLARRQKNRATDLSLVQPTSSRDMRNNNSYPTRDISHPAPQSVGNAAKNVVSPAKIAQAERQSSSEGELSDSSDEDQSHTERSRTLVRSATPRRSASPMRRIQIGRSGSRRSTSLNIKSLNYFPARERTTSIRDADGSNSGDEEPDQPAKKENPGRRMSVQDAISLFESKQKDQNSDIQKRRASGEASATAKSVLRRWSAGMGDSFNHSSHENAADSAPQDTKEESNSAEVKVKSSNADESPQVVQSSEMDNILLPPVATPAEPVVPKIEEVNDRVTTSAEWTRKKEEELKQMMLKMMESKPVKHQGSNGDNGLQQDVPSEQRGGFYSQYREKRDEKLRAEHAGKRAVKEAHFRVMKESLEQSTAKMASKSVSATGKRDSPSHSQRPRRNSSPPVLPKKEVSKPAGVRKSSPKTSTKTSALPATRNSWSAGPLPRTSGTPTPKTPGTVSANNTTNQRKPLSTPSLTQPSPRTQRLQQSKGKKGTLPDVKPNLKDQEEKKQRSVTKSTKNVKTKNPETPGDDSGVLSAKPSFYNKVTKKNSVVPLESKPFMKKGTGIGTKGSPIAAKPKVSQPDDSSKSSGSLIQPEENESIAVTSEPSPKILEVGVVQAAYDDANLELALDSDLSHNHMEDMDQGRDELDNSFKNAVELPPPEIQVDEDMGISSAAWVEVEREGGSASCDCGLPDLTTSPELASAAALSSPRVRHSLSQMLQADSNEPEIVEWGNAENPPSLVYQKDAPKGLKRLLKFARKSKGEANMTSLASPSVFSEGEDDTEESKAASKRSSDALLRKAALQAKGYEPPKSMLTGSLDGGNSSKRSTDYRGMNDFVPGMLHIFSEKCFI